MATAAVTKIVKQIKKLSPSEQQELRAVLDSLLAPAPSRTEREEAALPNLPVQRTLAPLARLKPEPLDGGGNKNKGPNS